jgi:hypothetical protein
MPTLALVSKATGLSPAWPRLYVWLLSQVTHLVQFGAFSLPLCMAEG